MDILGKLRLKSDDLPQEPGVYIMLDSEGQVIYVGKAKKLKNRVSSYFRGSHNAKTEALISNIYDFNIIVAASEFEALVLENSLIKKHMPKYNILLKDDKGYPFIRLDEREEYPKFTVVSGAKNDGAKYFGPYGGRNSTFSAVESVNNAFGLPTFSRVFPKDIGKERPCLNYHMGLCGGYCLKDTPKSEYDKAIKNAVMVFEGKTELLVKNLKDEMEACAKELRFERAAELRDKIKTIELLKTKQTAWSPTSVDTDAVGFFKGDTKSCFVVLHYIEGKLLDKDKEIISSPLEDTGEAISGLVRQYYSIRKSVPKYVLLQEKIDDLEELEKFLSEEAEHRVYVLCPERGEKKLLVKNAELNAREEIALLTAKAERVTKTAQWLREALGISDNINRIEAFDISNTGSSDVVAAMTVFEKGKPKKSSYRRFKIKTVEGQDDYGSMREVVRRRFTKYLEGDEKFNGLPDLLLIDGGAEHAGVARDVLRELKLKVPVFGMVKDNRHRTRGLISPDGEEIGIQAQPHVFSFIGKIQEETHRFAIEYNRKLHSKNMLVSELDAISGVGEKRKKDLINTFGSVKIIKTKSVEELSRVVPKNTARAIYDYFRR